MQINDFYASDMEKIIKQNYKLDLHICCHVNFIFCKQTLWFLRDNNIYFDKCENVGIGKKFTMINYAYAEEFGIFRVDTIENYNETIPVIFRVLGPNDLVIPVTENDFVNNQIKPRSILIFEFGSSFKIEYIKKILPPNIILKHINEYFWEKCTEYYICEQHIMTKCALQN